MKERILIVDDDMDVLETLKFALTMEDYDVEVSTNGQEALKTLNSAAIDLVVTDIKMPLMNGMELMRHIRQIDEDIEIIALTGHATVEIAVEALKDGAFDFLRKPLEDISQLFSTVEKALERRRLRQQNKGLLRQIRQLSAAVQQSPSIVMITDKRGNIEYVNPKFTEITGYESDEILGREASVLRSGLISQDIISAMWNTISGGKEWRGEFVNRKKSGELYWERASIKALKDDKDQITHFVKLAEDITEKKRIEIALRESERFNQLIIDTLPSNILVLDKNGVVLKANRVWLDFASEQLGLNGIGCNFLETCGVKIGDEEIISGVKRVLNGETDRFEKEFVCKAGLPERWLLLQACRLENKAEQTVISQTDITPIKQLESRLIHTHKMQAVATLAGGIAHQFNNSLSAIIGAAEMMKNNLPDSGFGKWLSIMESSSETMIKLTRQLLSFSQQGKYENKILSLNRVIRDTLPLLQDILGPRMTIISDLADDLLKIKADPSQMQMVLYELLLNSVEAVENSGTIRIESRNADASLSDEYPDIRKADAYIMLKVKDNGTGIEETIKDRIFEPFFTTKFQGRGLGLAAVYGIIRNHGGQISVHSEPGKGTEARILLPASDDVPKKKENSVPQEKKRGKNLLIIEDNEFNMQLAEILFSRLGFHVLKAENGTKGLETVKQYPEPIDLIYLDMILPDMGGEEIYPVIVSRRPHAKVIVCTGYSLQEAAEKIGISESDSLDFIAKPMTPSSVKEKLEKWFVLAEK